MIVNGVQYALLNFHSIFNDAVYVSFDMHLSGTHWVTQAPVGLYFMYSGWYFVDWQIATLFRKIRNTDNL